MSSLAETHERFGATFVEVGDRSVPARYARPRRTQLAVRSGVGVTEHPWGIITLEGTDRATFLGDTITCQLPSAEGDVSYGFLLDADGRIETDLYVVDAGERFVCLTAPGTAAEITSTWADRVFIQDVSVSDVTDDHAIFGVHGPNAAGKLASVMPRGDPPEAGLSMTRGALRDHGVTLIRLDAPIGEPGIAVLCRETAAAAVFDGLVNLGMAAAPFGYATWTALTLEAGTPTAEDELIGRQPNVCGVVAAGVDLAKGCFIGQEVVARVANLGQVRERIVGLQLEKSVEVGATVRADVPIGTVTRSVESPLLDSTVAMAIIRADAPDEVTVGSSVAGRRVDLPFVEGSEPSGRLPQYDAVG